MNANELAEQSAVDLEAQANVMLAMRDPIYCPIDLIQAAELLRTQAAEIEAMRETTDKFLADLFAAGWVDGCGCCAEELLNQETESVVEFETRLDAIRGEGE
jgi:hypothetical protein